VLTWAAMVSRRPWLGLALLSAYGLAVGLLLGATPGCGGAPSRLVTVKAGTGEGDIQFEVKNLTDVAINNFYLARTTSIPEQVDDNSPEAQAIWGGDLLSGAIGMGQRVPIIVPGPGQWDARAVDRDGRYQHVSGLKFQGGGRYILELNEGGWRVSK
jgi:hypothetical protein